MKASSIKHKLALLTSAAFLAGASSAAMAAPQFYAGAQAGYQNIDVEETVSGNWGSESTDYSGTGLAGGIFAGLNSILPLNSIWLLSSTSVIATLMAV